jgi:hypothetical protein
MASPDQKFSAAPVALVEQAAHAPKAMTYGRLRQRHPDYDAERMQELHDLHAGGYTIAKRAKAFLPQLCNESGPRHEERCRLTAFLGYFGQIVEQFSSDLFAQPLSIMAAADADNPNTPGDPPDAEFYKAFESDSDTGGTPFVDLMKDVTSTAMVQRTSFVVIDAPDASDVPAPKNRVEEDADGLSRLYAYELSPRQVIDWKEDGKGGFSWAIIDKREQDRETPFDVRDQVRETFTVWTMSGGVAEWARYAVTYETTNPPRDTDVVLLDREGTTKFKRIPVLRMELPKGLWVGNKVGPPQKEHWQRRSALNSAEARSLVAIPFVKRGPEIGPMGGAQPSSTQEDEHRGSDPVGRFNKAGFVEIGSGDSLEYAEPKGHCYELVHKELDELKDEIFRVAHQMAASVRPSAGALGRSGASKQQDGKATALVLRALGHEARQFALLIYRTISDARGEDVIWTANGLDNYEVIEREAVLEEAISLDQVAIPSETFKITYKTQVAEKLVSGVDPQTLDTIRKEIKAGVHAEHEVSELSVEAEKDELLNPTPPVITMPGVPPVTPPIAKAPKPPAVKQPNASAS